MPLTGIQIDDLRRLDERVAAIEKTLGIESVRPAAEPAGTHVSFGHGVPPPLPQTHLAQPPTVVRNEHSTITHAAPGASGGSHGKGGRRDDDDRSTRRGRAGHTGR